MISNLVTAHTKGGGTLVLATGSAASFGAAPFTVTVAKRTALKGNRVVDKRGVTVFLIASVSTDTLTIDSVTYGEDQAFAVGDVVASGQRLEYLQAAGRSGDSLSYVNQTGDTQSATITSFGRDILKSTGAIDPTTIGATTPGAIQAYRPINAQSGTTYTFVLLDNGKLVTLTNGSAITATVPTNASVAFPVGAEINLAQLGAGQVTVAAAGGVTINSLAGNLKLSAQYATGRLKKTATNTWLLEGSLSS